jgi:hypothetical protein
MDCAPAGTMECEEHPTTTSTTTTCGPCEDSGCGDCVTWRCTGGEWVSVNENCLPGHEPDPPVFECDESQGCNCIDTQCKPTTTTTSTTPEPTTTLEPTTTTEPTTTFDCAVAQCEYNCQGGTWVFVMSNCIGSCACPPDPWLILGEPCEDGLTDYTICEHV